MDRRSPHTVKSAAEFGGYQLSGLYCLLATSAGGGRPRFNTGRVRPHFRCRQLTRAGATDASAYRAYIVGAIGYDAKDILTRRSLSCPSHFSPKLDWMRFPHTITAALIGAASISLGIPCWAQYTPLPGGTTNAPPTVVGNYRSLGAGSVLNVSAGGTVGSNLRADASSVVNVMGGTVGWGLRAENGSRINISGGVVGYNFEAKQGSQINVSGGEVGAMTARTGSVVNIYGGTIGTTFIGEISSTIKVTGGLIESGFYVNRVDVRGGRFEPGIDVSFLNLFGGEFRLNGAVPASSSIHLTSSDILTGTLENGTPFLFSPLGGDDIDFISLNTVAVPVYSLSPLAINTPSSLGGLRAGQTATIGAGGSLGRSITVVDATLNLTGGTIDRGLKATNSVVNVSAGEMAGLIGSGKYAEAHFFDTEVNVSGGLIGESVELYGDSTFNLSGGQVGDWLRARAGSVINVSAGTIGNGLIAESGSQVHLSGGTIGRGVQAKAASVMTLTGGEFLLNGVAPTQTTLTLDADDILTGTLSDGSVFLFAPTSDAVHGVNLISAPLPEVVTTPIVVNSNNGPAGLRSGQTLIVQAGGQLGKNFTAVNASIQVAGGTLPEMSEIYGTSLDVSSGSVGTLLYTYAGSEITITGGAIGQGMVANGSTVNLIAGAIGEGARIHNSVLNVSGGTLGERYDPTTVEEGSIANISGGTIISDFDVRNSVANITGGTFEDVFGQAGAVINMSAGVIDELEAQAGSELNFSAGDIDRLDSKAGSSSTISGGLVRSVYVAGNVRITGGFVHTGLSFSRVLSGGVADISAGQIGDRFEVQAGGRANISGGDIGESFAAQSGSTVNISGGRFKKWFNARTGSQVSFLGGEFLLNGLAPTPDALVTLSSNDVVSGTLQDGSVFVFTPRLGDVLSGVAFKAATLPELNITPITVNSANAPTGLRPQQTLNLVAGGVLADRFTAAGATLNIAGGQAGQFLRVVDSDIAVSGGAVGQSLSVFGTSDVQITAGTIGNSFSAHDRTTVRLTGGGIGTSFYASSQVAVSVAGGTIGSSFTLASGTMEMTGGSIAAGFQATSNSRVQISGGAVGLFTVRTGSRVELSGTGQLTGGLYLETGGVVAVSGGTVNGVVRVTAGELDISGGAITGLLQVGADGDVNFLGRSFNLNGLPLNALTLHEPFVIEDRNVVLSGVLADGAPFSFNLNSASSSNASYFDLLATVTVSLVLPGDFNNDGQVDAADYVVWRKASASNIRLPGDVTPGAVTPADYITWRSNYGPAAAASALPAAVPEPMAWQIAVLGGLWLLRQTRLRASSSTNRGPQVSFR